LLPSGKLLTNEEPIITHDKEFYQILYAKEPIEKTAQQEAVHKPILLIRSRISDEHIRTIERV
jgi:hypothetical protein